MQRKIIHIDLDCFFAAVEMRDNPALRDQPIAVGGSTSSRGVIAACNYPARAFGVRSAMPTAQALKLCPHLQLLPGRMHAYKTASRQVMDILRRFSSTIEPLSLDEAYLDVSNSAQFQGSATRIAEAIRHSIQTETGLTASAGVAPNKFLAKIASDERKPDGIFVICPQQVSAFVARLAVQKIPGIGPKTAARLHDMGVHHCPDLFKIPLARLIRQFGAFSQTLLERCQGLDQRPVSAERVRKSVGVEHTYAQDKCSLQDCEAELPALLETLQQRLERHRATPLVHKLAVKLKFHDFQQTTVEQQLQTPDLAALRSLLVTAWQRGKGRPVRLIGLQAGLAEHDKKQLQLEL
ncbi:DNA polymerase IV [Alkalimonas mucilaginosa]|uniref:DNA polymerase IV n=1 Tax=Alkalimonas mucilaginosa TaxID=3057676 RepID=A0ABU7JG92_9GAMM|nr:DNA polymerase IV [Alkalimonas sp. MEB004]MEE2024702.1 DNA polymerase IV [Alkalimonas sp. MEB004]